MSDEALKTEVAVLTHNVTGIMATHRDISESLRRLVTLEEKTNQILRELQAGNAKVQDLETRLRNVELEVPGLKEARKWAISGVLGVIGVVGLAIVKLVLGGH